MSILRLNGLLGIVLAISISLNSFGSPIIQVSAVGGAGGNTVNSVTNSETDWFTTVNSTNDDLYRIRTGFGANGDQVYEAWHGDDDTPLLQSTITGLTSGLSYDVWVNYIRFGADAADPDGDRGAIEAGLASNGLMLFSAASGDGTNVGDAELTGFENDDRVGLRGFLGTAIADASGEISLFVDNLETDIGEERTWFDGFSFRESAVVPEPISVALWLVAGLGLAAFRRFRGRATS